MRRIVRNEINRAGSNTAMAELLREMGFTVDESNQIAAVVKKECRDKHKNTVKKTCRLYLTDDRKYLASYVKGQMKSFN